MSDAVIVQSIITGGALAVLLLQQRSQSKKITRIDDQTSNNHADADFPNLRDELSAMRESQSAITDDVKATRGLVHGVIRRVTGIEKHLTDVGQDYERIEDTTERRRTSAARDLEAAVEERNSMFAEVNRRINGLIPIHVEACPLRRPGDAN